LEKQLDTTGPPIYSDHDVAIQGRERKTQLNIRLTEREKVRLRRAANNHGLTVSEYLRKLAFDDDFRLENAGYEGLLAERLRREGKT